MELAKETIQKFPDDLNSFDAKVLLSIKNHFGTSTSPDELDTVLDLSSGSHSMISKIEKIFKVIEDPASLSAKLGRIGDCLVGARYDENLKNAWIYSIALRNMVDQELSIATPDIKDSLSEARKSGNFSRLFRDVD